MGVGCLEGQARSADCTDEAKRSARLAAKIREEWPLRSEDEVTRLVRIKCFIATILNIGPGPRDKLL